MHSTYTVESLRQSVAVANAKQDRKYFSLTAKQGEQLVADIQAHNAQLGAALEDAKRQFDFIVSSLAQGHTVSISSVQNCAANARAALASANQ
jgi:hypothetical protein